MAATTGVPTGAILAQPRAPTCAGSAQAGEAWSRHARGAAGVADVPLRGPGGFYRADAEDRATPPGASPRGAAPRPSTAPGGAAPPGEQHAEAGARGDAGTPQTTQVDELLDGFLAVAARDDLRSAPGAWGSKLAHSVFDEEEVLGRLPIRQMGPLDEFIDEMDIDDLESTGDTDDDAESDDGIDSYALAEFPRAAKVIQPLCVVCSLGRELADRCVICMDGLLAGQRVWRLPCTHVFHDVCVVRYLASRRGTPVCPTCRCDVKLAAMEAAERQGP